MVKSQPSAITFQSQSFLINLIHKFENDASDISHLLPSAATFGVRVGDGHPGHRFLADEVQDVAQGAVHAVLEALAQTHIQQGVEAAVEIGQAQRHDVGQVKSGTVRGMPRGDQYEEVHDVQREPAQEEAEHHSHDDPQCALGPGATPSQPPLRPAVHHQMAHQDHQEREDEPHEEAEGSDRPDAVFGVGHHTLSLVQACVDLRSVNKLGDAADQGQDPHSGASKGSHARSPVVLTPDGSVDQHQAVHADQNQLQDAAVHHQVEEAFD